jgi:hypothetical protein
MSKEKPRGGNVYQGPSADELIEVLSRHYSATGAAQELGISNKRLTHCCRKVGVKVCEHRKPAEKPAPNGRPMSRRQIDANRHALDIVSHWASQGYDVTASVKFDRTCAEWRIVSDLVNGLPRGYRKAMLHAAE